MSPEKREGRLGKREAEVEGRKSKGRVWGDEALRKDRTGTCSKAG